MRQYSILRTASKILVAPIILFALYVQFHGDFGPGGGFQAGVIFAVGVILYGLIYGVDAARRVTPMWVLRPMIALGVLIYGGVGVVAMMMGGNYLDYSVFSPDHPAHGQHLGILLVELGVGITVASVMITIFFMFAGRR